MRIADEGPTTAVMDKSANVDDMNTNLCRNLKALFGALKAEKKSKDQR
jgi:hypothetical protein